MAELKKVACPECQGHKTVPGECVCDSEWRGTRKGNDWEECQCNDEAPCPLCNGKGYVFE